MAATQVRLPLLTEKASGGVVKSFSRFRSSTFPLIRARSSDPGDGNVDDRSSLKDDDTRYVLKLGVGSVAGAAVIKYGSVLVPQVTKPNLAEALFIIITPVMVAAIILLTKSRSTN